MAELKIFTTEGETLTVWFGVPADEVICEDLAEFKRLLAP